VTDESALVAVLLDRAARVEARDEAAAALSTHDAAEAEDALVAVACDASEPVALLDRCGASIAAIWARHASLDTPMLERLSERARGTLLRTLDALSGASIAAEARARDAFQIGSALLKSGDYAGAIEALETSAAHDPHFKTLELLGEAFLLSGEPKRAVVPLAAATTLNAQVRAPSLLAQALHALGDELRAHEMARLALARDAGDRAAQAVLEATQAAYDRWNAL
jgi:tetratricopeptide (TPR) repeat protein